MLCVCIFESINTQRYLNREKAHCRNRHHRDILIITLFVGNHAPLFLRSIHSLHLPSDLPPLPSLFQFNFTFFTFRLMPLSEDPLSRDSLKKKKNIHHVQIVLHISVRRERNQIVIEKRSRIFIFIHQKRIQTRIGKNEKRAMCAYSLTRAGSPVASKSLCCEERNSSRTNILT